MFKNIIILIWWIIVLIVFKVTTNFEFSNGNSLIFVGLLVIIPLTLFIIANIFKKKLMKEGKKNKIPYFQRIKEDIKSKTFYNEFLSKISTLNFSQIEEDNKIILVSNLLEIVFSQSLVSISIKNTQVIYRYYYSNKFTELSKYDKKYLQYKGTSVLYQLLVEKVLLLSNNELTYFENKKHAKLILTATDEVLFTNSKKVKFKLKRSLNAK